MTWPAVMFLVALTFLILPACIKPDQVLKRSTDAKQDSKTVDQHH